LGHIFINVESFGAADLGSELVSVIQTNTTDTTPSPLNFVAQGGQEVTHIRQSDEIAGDKTKLRQKVYILEKFLLPVRLP